MKAGIIGLPSVGKSTLFQLLTGSAALAPGGRPEARLGVARVPDPRVEALAAIYDPRKKTWATVEYADVHVVRAFEAELVPHPDGSVDPLRDAKMIELELILADLSAVERRLERLEANLKKTNKAEDAAERALFLKMNDWLEAEHPLRELALAEEDRRRLRSYSFLSGKPMLLVVNLGEDGIREAAAFLERSGLQGFASRPLLGLCPVAAPIEAEMTELSPEDAKAFREDLGLLEPGLERVIRTSYALLGLISFLTAGEDECRAWTIRKGTKAQAAAGTIHSDLERGFIRAEVVAFEDLLAAGSIAACREQGTLRLEGKDYEVRDGDVINFRFNV